MFYKQLERNVVLGIIASSVIVSSPGLSQTQPNQNNEFEANHLGAGFTYHLAQNRPVEVIGKTDQGDKITLLTSTIHQVDYGEATEFDYVLENTKTSRLNHATTGSCNANGKVDLRPNLEEGTTGYQWFVFQQNEKKISISVTATSVASKKLLDRVCYYSRVNEHNK